MLGGLEELCILATGRLKESASGVRIQELISTVRGKSISYGAIYTALDRMEAKGLLRSNLSASTPKRGGRRVRYFHVTDAGREELEETRRVRREVMNPL